MVTQYQWETITPESRQRRDPMNAAYSRMTGFHSFLGGSIMEYADSQGRDLGESHSIPVNLAGEVGTPGGYRKPGEVIFTPPPAP